MEETDDQEMGEFQERRAPGVAARSNQKEQSEKARYKRAGRRALSKASQIDVAARRRVVDPESRVQKGVTQLDFTQWDAANPIGIGVRGLEQASYEAQDPAPLAAGSTGGGPSSVSPPGRRVTITFHVYQRGEWRRTDTVSVNSKNLVEAQLIADRYTRDPDRETHFYNRLLRKVAVDKYIRAAINSSFTILIILSVSLNFKKCFSYRHRRL